MHAIQVSQLWLSIGAVLGFFLIHLLHNNQYRHHKHAIHAASNEFSGVQAEMEAVQERINYILNAVWSRELRQEDCDFELSELDAHYRFLRRRRDELAGRLWFLEAFGH